MRLLASVLLGVLAFATGCNEKIAQPSLEPFTFAQATDARRAADQLIGANGRALFICGQSDGLGMFAMDWKAGFMPDGMKDGRLVFLIRNDGREDVFFRDAAGSYLSSLDDGADVQRISDPARDVESWVVSYASNGIVETHNLTTVPDDGLVNLWTSNKPTSIVGASAKLFRSKCVRA